MINWFDMPAEGLSNGGLFEVKELEVTENGTYETKGEMYNKVTVNVEGGGSSWQTVFEGSVTTTAEDNVFSGEIEGLGSLTANTIKVTFNGVEYTCERDQDGYYGAPFNFETEQYNWSEFPFVINTSEPGETWLVTETAGTYTLKIEEPQSGGSSDFSTATVTLESSSEFVEGVSFSCVQDDGVWVYSDPDTGVYTVPLFNGINNIQLTVLDMNVNVSGSAEMRGAFVRVTGDCTITIS